MKMTRNIKLTETYKFYFGILQKNTKLVISWFYEEYRFLTQFSGSFFVNQTPKKGLKSK